MVIIQGTLCLCKLYYVLDSPLGHARNCSDCSRAFHVSSEPKSSQTYCPRQPGRLECREGWIEIAGLDINGRLASKLDNVHQGQSPCWRNSHRSVRVRTALITRNPDISHKTNFAVVDHCGCCICHCVFWRSGRCRCRHRRLRVVFSSGQFGAVAVLTSLQCLRVVACRN